MDVKIGRKSYDPFASSEKIQQQVSKYPLMEEIGFLVLGMRVRVIFSLIHTFLVTCSSLENYRCHIYFGIRLSITPQCGAEIFTSSVHWYVGSVRNYSDIQNMINK